MLSRKDAMVAAIGAQGRRRLGNRFGGSALYVSANVPNYKDVTLGERAQMRALYLRGETFNEIAPIVGRSVMTVSSYIGRDVTAGLLPKLPPPQSWTGRRARTLMRGGTEVRAAIKQAETEWSHKCRQLNPEHFAAHARLKAAFSRASEEGYSIVDRTSDEFFKQADRIGRAIATARKRVVPDSEPQTQSPLAADLLAGVPAIAAYLGMTQRAVYHMADQNRIPTFKIGSKIHARKSELDAAFTSAGVRFKE